VQKHNAHKSSQAKRTTPLIIFAAGGSVCHLNEARARPAQRRQDALLLVCHLLPLLILAFVIIAQKVKNAMHKEHPNFVVDTVLRPIEACTLRSLPKRGLHRYYDVTHHNEGDILHTDLPERQLFCGSTIGKKAAISRIT
jgi:hypothetical protein